MQVSKPLVREWLLYDLKVGLFTAELSRSFGDNAVSERICFKKFWSGDLCLCEERRSDRTHVLEYDAQKLVTYGELTERFHVYDEIDSTPHTVGSQQANSV